MASGDIGIEEVADLYEKAERLHAVAAERLAKVQARIDALAPRDLDAP
jgi:exonuclease VII small subunit